MSALDAWRTERAAIADGVHARIAASYGGEAEIARAIAEVVADESAGRFEGERDESERRAWAALVARPPGAETLRAIAGLYLDDIAGGFDRTTFRAAMAVLPPLFALLFRGGGGDRVVLDGAVARARELAGTHTLVLAPTHSSNLDSFILGSLIHRAGFPPFVYAAGKHMYRSKVAARLMSNLGAYRVDRARTAELYKDVLKAYATELLDRGFHSVIFPGATRCRTNDVEVHLKLGLLGTTAHARRPIAIVPVTINYEIVLEAQTLIRYFLDGRAGERIVGEGRGLGAKLRKLISLENRAVVRVGEAIDPRGATPLGAAISQAFRRGTVLFATHLTARAVFDVHGGDPLALARAARGSLAVAAADVHVRLSALIRSLRDRPEDGALHGSVAGASPAEIVALAERAWSAGHGQPAAHNVGDRLVVDDPGLLYFYRNRTGHLVADR